MRSWFAFVLILLRSRILTVDFLEFRHLVLIKKSGEHFLLILMSFMESFPFFLFAKVFIATNPLCGFPHALASALKLFGLFFV